VPRTYSADLLPPLSLSAFDDLVADVEANGQRVPIVVTPDGVVIDGHHRFAAMLLVDPEAKQKVRVINAPIREALEKSFDLPGVFRADLQDNIVSMDEPLDLARKKGSTWKQRNGKFYGKNRKGKNGGPYETEEAAKKFATGR
jgi:hypothetical protein